MNLFVLDKDHELNAQYHNDKHVNKMILEAAQIISTNTRILFPDLPDDFCYRKTHQNHPCTVWARQTVLNFEWVVDYARSLCVEKIHRTGKGHKSMRVVEKCAAHVRHMSYGDMPMIGLTQHAMAMPVHYRTEDVVHSYRAYYIGDKQHLAAWKKRPIPFWWSN